MTQSKTTTIGLAAIAFMLSAGLATAQSSVGGPHKPTSTLGGAAVQANPVVVTPRGRPATLVPTPPKPVLPPLPVATKQPPKLPKK
jgi:hypothetical protein